MTFILTFPAKKRRCFMCLKTEKDEETTSFPVSDRLHPFSPLLDYLIGEENDTKGTWSSLEETVPPVCIACFDILAGLFDLHQGLIEIQRKIEVQTSIARSVVRRSVGGLVDDHSVVNQLRAEIIKNYNQPVTFPARLPPQIPPPPPEAPPSQPEEQTSSVVWLLQDTSGQLLTAPTFLIPSSTEKSSTQAEPQEESPPPPAVEVPSNPCDVCSIPVPQPFHASHLSTHVPSEYIFSCESCQVSFLTPFRLHTYHESLQKPCSTYSPSSISTYLQCSLCSLHFPNIYTLKSHLNSHSNSPLTLRCPLCPSKFSSKSSILFHLQSSHIAHSTLRRPESCTICSQSLPVTELESHYLHTHQLTAEQIFKCRLCPSVHTSVNGVIEHQRRAFKRKLHKISCHQCKTSSFKDLSRLRHHYLVKHQVRDRFRCRRCHAVFHSVGIYPTDEFTCKNIPDEELSDLTRSISWKFRCEKCSNINILADDQ